MRWVLGLFLILASCGPTVVYGPNGKVGSAFRGKRKVNIDVIRREGSCAQLPTKSQTTVEFNALGELKPPYIDVHCSTTSPPFSVQCDSVLGNVHASCTSGLLGTSQNGFWCNGEGEFHGQLWGCHYIAFDFTVLPLMP
jgi:hypothetical protein